MTFFPQVSPTPGALPLLLRGPYALLRAPSRLLQGLLLPRLAESSVARVNVERACGAADTFAAAVLDDARLAARGQAMLLAGRSRAYRARVAPVPSSATAVGAAPADRRAAQIEMTRAAAATEPLVGRSHPTTASGPVERSPQRRSP